MITRRSTLKHGSLAALLASFIPPARAATYRVTLTEAEWQARLTPDQFLILRKDATERPWTSALLDEKRPGAFTCVGCDTHVFSSETKYDSRTGWPSFWAPVRDAVGETEDTSENMVRTAVHCAGCGGHLGHVFPDGPKPTGLRYCINGLVLAFKPA